MNQILYAGYKRAGNGTTRPRPPWRPCRTRIRRKPPRTSTTRRPTSTNAGSIPEALAKLEQVVGFNPNHPEALNMLGPLLRRPDGERQGPRDLQEVPGGGPPNHPEAATRPGHDRVLRVPVGACPFGTARGRRLDARVCCRGSSDPRRKPAEGGSVHAPAARPAPLWRGGPGRRGPAPARPSPRGPQDDVTLERIMGPSRLAGSPAGGAPYWSSDGDSVYFQRKREGEDARDLYRVDLEARAPVRVSDRGPCRCGRRRRQLGPRAAGRRAFVKAGDVFVRDLGPWTAG